MESTIIAYLLENGPVSAMCGVFIWLWLNERKEKQKAVKALLDELQGQIALWKDLKERADAAHL